MMFTLVQLAFAFALSAMAHAQDSFVLDPSILDQASVSQEKLGRIYLSDLFLSPSFDYSEPKSGQFLIGRTYLAADWTNGDLISGHFAYGTESLIGVPARYGVVDENAFAITEAYAQVDSDFGRGRLGFQPIPFGLESGVNEANLRFERSLLYQRGYMGIRDIGIGYSISNDGFFNDWLIHNGEGGKQLDNQTWFTTRIGYHRKFFTTGLSAQTGKTNPLSTDPGGNLSNTPGGSPQATGIDIDEGAKYRLFNFFFAYRSKDIETSLEFTTIDIYQQDQNHHPNTGHIDIYVPIKEKWGAMFRYDYFDSKQSGNPTSQEYTVGACLKSKYETSNLYLFVTRHVLPAPLNDSHQVLLAWRISPFATKYN